MKSRHKNNLINFYKNKKIFITGHSGFKGSWLTFVLSLFGSKITGYSLKPIVKPSNFELLNLKQNIKKNYFCDVRDKKKLNLALRRSRPDIIFHLAAQPLVKRSYLDPIETFETNINGTLNILEASKNLKSLKSLVIITSDKCYKNNEKKSGYKETDELGGYDPYSGSKAAVENVFHSYCNAKFKYRKKIGVVSARAGNVIGGGDWSNYRLIPDFIKSLMRNKQFEIRSPNSVRPWQHVLDLINGYLILGMKSYGNNKFNGSWNFGPYSKRSKKVIEIVMRLKKYLNVKKPLKIKRNKNLKETNLLFLNSKKSLKYLKWKPKFTILRSIDLTAIWYQEYLKNQKVEKITEKQIKEFYNI